jgi:hypothetical protein
VVLRVPSDYATIQQALDAAVSGDSVLVAPGTYTNCDGEPCTASVAVLKDGVTLISEGGWKVTTLRVDTAAGSLPAVVLGWGIVTEGATLKGFRITATAPGYYGAAFVTCQGIRIEDCVFEDVAPGWDIGGGLFTNGCIVEVRDCEFRRCAAVEGAGYGSTNGSSIVETCIFEECEGGGASINGLSGTSAAVRDCVFRNNTGHAALSVLSMPQAEICQNVFDGNTSADGGAAALAVSNSAGYATVEGNLFVGNVAVSQTFVVGWSTSGEVRGNTFYGNTCPANRAVLSRSGSWPTLFANNIFAGNLGGPAIRASVEPPEASCNLFWSNAGGDYEGYVPSPTDLFVDPHFCDPEAGDFQLMSDSPCLPENSGTCGLIGAFGEGCGTVSLTPSSWGLIKSRFR